MEINYLINMDDGRIVDRNPETDTHVNLRPIPDAVVEMIMRGEVTTKDVISAISAKIKESGEFDLSKYIEDLKRLNVRTSNPQKAPERVKLADREDTISVEDLAAARSEKKARAKKIASVLSAE